MLATKELLLYLVVIFQLWANGKHNMRYNYFFVLFISLIIYASAAYSGEKNYSACGATPEEARKELGRSLYTNVKSRVSKRVTENRNSFFDYFTAKTTAVNEQSSRIVLCDVNMQKEDGQFCASVTHKALSECARKRLERQMNYVVTNLPDTESVRLKKARAWLDEIVSSGNLYTAVGKQAFDQGKLKKLVAIENDLLKLLDNQYVRFAIEGTAVKIIVDDTRKVLPNQDIKLKVGTHAYQITSPGHCAINKTFKLTSKGRAIIRHDMSDFTYPEITFTSNPPTAVLKIGGNSSKVGVTRTVKRCEGVLPYAFSLEGVNKTGKVKLAPGLKKTVAVKFTPPSILSTAKAYRGGKKLWQFQFHTIFPTHKDNGTGMLTGGKVSWVSFQDTFRWGYSGAFASDGDNSYAYELSVELNLQLLDYNLGREALFLGPFVLIPSIGIETGLAYHTLDGENDFGDANASNWEAFYQSYFIFRPKLGIDAAFNKDFLVSLNLSRSLFMNKSNIVSAGIGFRF